MSHLREVTDVYKPPKLLLILCFTVAQTQWHILSIQSEPGTFVCCYILSFPKNKRQGMQLAKNKK